MIARLHLALAVAALAAACSTNPVVPNPIPIGQLPPASPDYHIAAGDELDIRMFYTPDLNQTVAVRPDGKISLALLGEVVAAGRSPGDLARSLEQSYGERIKRPQTVVNVKGFAMQRVFVGGEVWRPGVQPLSGPLSVLQAVLVAEGPRDTARMTEVVVVRRGEDGRRQVFVVDLTSVISGRDGTQDVPLQPFDVVVVPRSDIADLDLWVDQYIRRVLPFYTSANFGYELRR